MVSDKPSDGYHREKSCVGSACDTAMFRITPINNIDHHEMSSIYLLQLCLNHHQQEYQRDQISNQLGFNKNYCFISRICFI